MTTAHSPQTAVLAQPWVIVPTYNERTNIAPLIETIFAQPIEHLAVLVVDDSSPDGTASEVLRLQARYHTLELLTRPSKSGLGNAYITGMTYALEHGATAIVQMDADFSHDPADIPRLLHRLQTADAVIGSRYAAGISVVNWPLKRLLLSMAANLYVRLITGLPLYDGTGGFRAWRAQTLRDLNLSTVKADGYGFQIVLAHRAWKQNKHLVELPIIFTERREGQSKMNRQIIREATLLVWKLRLLG